MSVPIQWECATCTTRSLQGHRAAYFAKHRARVLLHIGAREW